MTICMPHHAATEKNPPRITEMLSRVRSCWSTVSRLTDDGHDALSGGGLEHGGVARDLAPEGARSREVDVVEDQLTLRREVRLQEGRFVVIWW